MNDPMPRSQLLIVVPCYNESRRLPAFLAALAAQWREGEGVSILVVDDGSAPEESAALKQIVDKARAENRVVREILRLPENQGKGAAIRAGWAAHQGEEWLAFADADGACSATEVRRLSELARSATAGLDAIFASRVLMLGRTVRRLLHRHLLGRIFATLVSEYLHIPVYDSQCGLKFVRRTAYEKTEPRLQLNRYAFDVELLAFLLDEGFSVREEPVDWQEVPGGKVRLFRDAFRMSRDVLDVGRRRKGAQSL